MEIKQIVTEIERLLKYIPTFLLCLCTLAACGGDDDGDDNGGNGSSGSNNGTVVADGKCMLVDLGLPSGLLWADRNLGANSPYAQGELYAWGETATKERFDNDTYDWDKFRRKYDTENSGDDLTLQPEDDAATVKWGKRFRMPTMKEMKELLNKCVWTCSSSGYTVTGPNGKSIFFPFAYVNENGWYVAEYWSSTNKKDRRATGGTVGGVYCISLNSEVMGKYNEYVSVPYSGMYIRPVATK